MERPPMEGDAQDYSIKDFRCLGIGNVPVTMRQSHQVVGLAQSIIVNHKVGIRCQTSADEIVVPSFLEQIAILLKYSTGSV